MESGYLHMRQCARVLRADPTPAERRLWTMLRARQCGGLRFLRQRRIGQYIADFYCPAARLVIEVDGGVHERPEVAERDAARTEGLREDLGITVLRWTNAQVLSATPTDIHAKILALVHISGNEK